ncbi:MAG TPA: PIN domain-containing protein [Vicinamibacteria bacterium]|nr:PIN domain-containing protein [Vicinamibacteria bacterium]
MSDREFIDSSVLVHSDDHDAPRKQSKALDLIERSRRAGTGVISTQVLQEYFVTATRKLGVPAVVAREKIIIFSHFEVARVSVDDLLAAIDLHRLHELSFWDGLILRSALSSGCNVLYTEDMQDGRRFEALRIVNPFR